VLSSICNLHLRLRTIFNMPGAEGTPQTLYDKVLQAHIVDEKLDGTILLYIGQSTLMCLLSSIELTKILVYR
jgi:hypothetical protein